MDELYCLTTANKKKKKSENSASPSTAKKASYTKSKMVQALHMQLSRSLGVKFLKWSRGLMKELILGSLMNFQPYQKFILWS